MVCDEIISKYPNQLDALILKSDILKDQNKPAEALIYLEKAYAFAPKDKELAYNLAYDLAEEKNARALTLTDTLLMQDVTETSARAYYIKATYYNISNKLTDALKNYDLAIQKDYNFLDAYLDKGKLLYNLKNYSIAFNTFQLGLKVSPTTAEFYYWIGKTQQALGKKAEAKLNYLRAYNLDKTLKEARDSADNFKD